MRLSYHSSIRRSCLSSASFHHTTECDGHTDGCCRKARYPCTPLRKYEWISLIIQSGRCLFAQRRTKHNNINIRESYSSWSRPPAGGSLGTHRRSCWLWCRLCCRDTPTEHAQSSLTHRKVRSWPAALNCWSIRLDEAAAASMTLTWLTAVVLVAVVVTVQVSVTAFACQHAATWPALEVARRALCHHENTHWTEDFSFRSRKFQRPSSGQTECTVDSGLWQQAGCVSSLLWKLTAVWVFRPLQSHNAEHRLTLLLCATTQWPAGREGEDRVREGERKGIWNLPEE